MLLDELEERRVDRRPDRVPGLASSPRARACPRRERRPRGRAPSRGRRRRPRSAGRPRRSARSPRAGAASRRGRRAGSARPTSRSSRSRLSARCAPRFVPATACTSSRMSEARPLSSISRACDVSMRKSDSGVVIRISGGRLQDLRPLFLRRVARANGDVQVEPDAGERPAQVPLDVVVERLERADVEHLEALARAAPGRAPRGTRRASCPTRSGPG